MAMESVAHPLLVDEVTLKARIRPRWALLLPNVPLVCQIAASCYRAIQGPDVLPWALLCSIWVSDMGLFHTGFFFMLPVPACIHLEKVGSVMLQGVVVIIWALWGCIMVANGATWQWSVFVLVAAIYIFTEFVPALRTDFWKAGPAHGQGMYTHTGNLIFELCLWSLYA
mmetsp:Transcript_58287/g.177667  ORF Transcript_58287/g.177667 Transcript_58287/m.177667 type:complete len:169 (-) Transcript_58287:261-767(-)